MYSCMHLAVCHTHFFMYPLLPVLTRSFILCICALFVHAITHSSEAASTVVDSVVHHAANTTAGHLPWFAATHAESCFRT